MCVLTVFCSINSYCHISSLPPSRSMFYLHMIAGPDSIAAFNLLKRCRVKPFLHGQPRPIVCPIDEDVAFNGAAFKKTVKKRYDSDKGTLASLSGTFMHKSQHLVECNKHFRLSLLPTIPHLRGGFHFILR